MSDEANDRWATVGKILTVIATAIAVLYGVIQIYDRYYPKDAEIVAVCDRSSFSIPPAYYEKLSEWQKVIKPEEIEKFISLDSDLKDEERQILSRAFADYLDRRKSINPDPLSAMFSYGPINNIEQCRISVKNIGSKEATDLKLQIRDKGYYKFSKTGEEWNSGSFENSIALGSLHPDNEVVILVWREDSSPFELIKITHPNGVVEVGTSERVTGFLAWLHKERGGFKGLGWGLLMLLGVYAIVYPLVTFGLRAKFIQKLFGFKVVGKQVLFEVKEEKPKQEPQQEPQVEESTSKQ
jgi:hypothetical protein